MPGTCLVEERGRPRATGPDGRTNVCFGGMFMETGMLIRWGAPRPGREKESLELFKKCAEYYRRLVDEGKLTYCEPFMLGSGDSEVEAGFFILKGEVSHVFS